MSVIVDDERESPLNVVRALVARADRLLARVDPNDDPDAEPLSVFALAALFAAIAVSVHMFVKWRVQPMQDLGHHIALSAVVADWGRPGSLYTALYEPIDPFAANSLMYTLAGLFGRVFGVVTAVRACIVFYLAGVPLANLVALRIFGRSAWPAVLAVPLVYNMNYVAGFANLLFAAPLMVLLLPLFYRALDRRSPKLVVAVSLLFTALLLAHAHAFLWTGFLCFLVALGRFVVELSRGRARAALIAGGCAAAAVLPSLVVFAHWYRRTFGAARTAGGIQNATATFDQNFGAVFETPARQLQKVLWMPWKVVLTDQDLRLFVALLVLALVAVALSRSVRYRKPPVMELAFVVTAASYFFLPEGIQGHDIIASRQIGISLWFLPAVVAPVPFAFSPVARAVVVGGILAITQWWLGAWNAQLAAFEADEVNGLVEVLAAAPPRLRMHYAKFEPESAYFAWRPFWHVDKFYMGDGFGQIPDTPGILSTSAIRYREGVDIHRLLSSPYGWTGQDEIWQNFELILVHKWHPSATEQATAERRGRLLKKMGDWELWQSNEVISKSP